jgi:hypothetical protein
VIPYSASVFLPFFAKETGYVTFMEYARSRKQGRWKHMKTYKVTLMRLGKGIVTAESKEEAAKIAASLPETEISWLTETDAAPGGYLVVFVEEINGNRECETVEY